MAFYPAHCDHKCDGCQKNNGCGWCIYYDKPIGNYVSGTFSTTTEMFSKNQNKEK